jgi:Tol biopolymer transport system component
MAMHRLATGGAARVVCVLAMGIFAAACGDSSTSAKPPLADERLIALTSDSDNAPLNGSDGGGGTSIFTMHADGSHKARLTSAHFLDAAPAWSPDGSSITFESSRTPAGIWIMNADGSNQRALLTDAAFQSPSELRWSPDGHSIAFNAYVDNVSSVRVIMIANADGSHAHRLTTNVTGEHWASWSPDGNRIAFMAISGPIGYSIFIVNSDGSAQQQLTSDADGEPAWSPDGTHIAFVNFDDSDHPQIFVMGEDGSDRRALSTGGINADPAWSPDSRQLAYDRNTNESDSNSPLEIFRMNADGSDARAITSFGSVAGAFSEAWSPAWKPVP